MNQKPTYEELERRVRDLEQAESERKRTAEAAQNTSELLSFFIKHSPIYAFLKIVSHRDSKVLYASENYIDMIGVPGSQMLGKTMHELFSHEFAEKITRDDIDVIRNGKNLKLEEELNGRNYITYKFPLMQGGNKYLAGYTVDITDLKRTEEELFQIFTMSLDMICIADIDTATFIKVNPAFTEILGYSEEALLEKPFLDFVHPDDIDATRGVIEQKLRSGAKIINFENRYRCEDGSYRWLSWVSHPNLEKGITYAVARDITKWKENEKELKKGKALLDAAGRMARVGGWEVDTVTLEVIWTEETYRIHEVPFDYKPSLREAINFFHPDDRGRLEKAINRSLDHGESYDLELRFITAKGNYLWTRTMCQPEVVDGKIVRLKGTFQDITKQKNIEEALRKSEKDLRQSQRIAHLGSWRLDLATNQVEWTKELYKMYGFDPALPPPPYTEHMKLFTPESWERLSTSLSKTSETGIPYELELETVREDGSNGWMWVRGETISDAAGKTIGLWGAAQDITMRKRTELALKESEDRFRALHNASFGGIAIHDKGLILECNKGLSEITGYTYDELIGMDGLYLISDDTRDKVIRNIEAGYEKPYEATGVRKNGELYPLRLEARNIPYKGKNVRVVEFRDITENKHAEKEREELEGKLRQAHKMEAVGRLAGGVAHDFNNMLSVILGNADMALEEIDPAQPLYATIEEIIKAGKRSAGLTRQLLAFARKQTVSPEVLDLNKTVGRMSKMIERLIGENIDLAWLPGENVWPVKVDPSQIDQILANLCLNARDAIADVGKVTIETGNAEFDETYCTDHPGFVPGKYVLMAVSDSGCGMDTETLENIFEPFFTTKDVDKGTGLGLATVYGIVKQNNGFINVYSEPGQGTTFKIYLPRYRTAKMEFLPEKVKEPQTERGHETILLVEDEPSILKMTTMMLERLGYEVVAAKTPGEAIRLAQEHTGKIDLLVTDVVMPEMNGRDLAKNILSIHPNLNPFVHVRLHRQRSSSPTTGFWIKV